MAWLCGKSSAGVGLGAVAAINEYSLPEPSASDIEPPLTLVRRKLGLLERVFDALEDAIVVRNAEGAVLFENATHKKHASVISTGGEASVFIPAQRVQVGPNEIAEVLKPISPAKAQSQALLEVLPNLVYTTSGRGDSMKQVFVKNRYLQQFYTDNAVTSETINSATESMRSVAILLMDAATVASSRADWDRAMAAGAVYEKEFRSTLGTRRWYLSRSVPISFDADGGSSEYVGTITDIDDQKRAQEAQRQQLNERKLFAAVLEQLPVAVAIAQPDDGHIIFANAQAEVYMPCPPTATLQNAVSRDQRAGSMWANRTSVDDLGLLGQSNTHAILNNASNTELSHERAAGAVRHSHATGAAGAVTGKQKGSDLFSHAISRALLRNVAGQSSDDKEEILLHALDGAVQSKRRWGVVVGDGNSTVKAVGSKGNESRTVQVMRSEVLGVDGTALAMVMVVEDITLQRQLEAERLQQASKAVHSAFGNMSHELRTPLNAVLGFADLMLATTRTQARGGSESPMSLSASPVPPAEALATCAEYAHGIKESGKLLLCVINDILDYMRSESGNLRLERAPFHVRGCVGVVENMMAPEAQRRGVELRVTVHDDVPAVALGDAVRLSQVLVNLLSNALKFTSKGGQVTCKVAMVTAAASLPLSSSSPGVVAEELTLPGSTLAGSSYRLIAPDGASSRVSDTVAAGASAAAATPAVSRGEAGVAGQHKLRVEVQDTGVGIAPSVLLRLFRPFSQADASTTRTHGGTGLGLSICKQLVELMGGRIDVSSAVGEGSTFWFEVPMEVAALPVGDHRATTGSANDTVSTPLHLVPPSQDVPILLADDNSVNILVCSRMLKLLGYTNVTTVSDGVQAVKAVAESRTPFRVCLMDVQMPVCDGLEATRRIRALPDLERAATPVIAISASVLEHDVAECLAAGMQGHVAKPVVARALSEALKRWVRS